MPAPGTVIGGRYRLERRIGEGATAAIWEAEHLTLGRPVAVKFLHHVGPPKSEAAQRFVREARVAAAIKHRNVIDILDFGLTDEDGQPYMVMERLEGRTLADHVHALGVLPIGEAARIVSLILRGLSAVHDAGIVHRDLKPENVFLVHDEDGPFPKLLDFGLSRRVGRGDMTQEGMLLGTPDYMSPEQAQGSRNLDARTDIYSMGVILYELVTGRMPFEGGSLAELLAKVVEEPPIPLRSVRPDVPDALVDIVERAMAKDPAQRFANARDMRNALAAADLGMSIAPESGLISLSERPPPPKGAFGGGEVSTARRPSKGSAQTPAPARRKSHDATPAAPAEAVHTPGDGATQLDVRVPELEHEEEPSRPSHQRFPRPADAPVVERADAPAAAPTASERALADTMPAATKIEIAVPSGAAAAEIEAPRREPTGKRAREDSVSTFVVTAKDGEAERARAGSPARTAFLFLLLLAAAAGAGWWVYGDALGLGDLAPSAVLGTRDAGGSPPMEDAGLGAVAGAAALADAGTDVAPAPAADAGPGDAGPADAGAETTALDAGTAPVDGSVADGAVTDGGLAEALGPDAADAGEAAEEDEPPGRRRGIRRRPRRRR